MMLSRGDARRPRVPFRLSRSAGAFVAVGLIAAASTGACFEPDPVCYAGDYRACSCPSTTASRGYQVCVAPDGWASCVCDGTTPGVDGSAPDGSDDAPDAPAPKKGMLEACGGNEECETGLCFSFNAKGQRCTKPCTSGADCPPPSPGCNNQGICKAP